MKISFSSTSPTHGMIIVPVLEEAWQTDTVTALDAQTDGALLRSAKTADFTGKSDQSLILPAPAAMPEAVLVLLGLGKAKDLLSEDAAGVGGKAYAFAKGKAQEVSLMLGDLDVAGVSGADLAVEAALGARLRAYEFLHYKKKTAEKEPKPVESFTLITNADTAALAEMEAVAAGVYVARDLVSEPPNILHPESYAERCRDLEKLGIEVTILDEAQMKKLGMGSLLGVGQGSIRESRLVAMNWKGGKEGEAPIALIGKGVTFDTGGISLKPGAGMEDMKFDMGGSAAVVGAMHALAARKAKANVVGLIGLVENMPGSNAQRPSDVVTAMSGQTIEILNTDAEGRLVLADVVTYAHKTFAPKAMVDLATLTGAIIISLASEFAGLFTKDDALADALLAAGTASGEKLWRMPLTKNHDEMIKSTIADIKNMGPREAGSSTAAAFIGRFVEKDTPWAHLDIAGTAWTTKDLDICPKGATGYGVRLLDEWIRTKYEG